MSVAAPLVYAIVVPLGAGIDGLTQRPDFAHEGRLSIAYLLASHSFEHVLDTLFLALLSLLLMTAGQRGGA